jgi:hypothetical protein
VKFAHVPDFGQVYLDSKFFLNLIAHLSNVILLAPFWVPGQSHVPETREGRREAKVASHHRALSQQDAVFFVHDDDH